MQKIDLVLSGSGTLLVCHIGAYSEIAKRYEVARVAGTSGGGIVAAGVAFGWDAGRMLDLADKFLSSDILERNLIPWNGWSLYRNRKPRKLIRQTMPYKMGDAKIPFGVFALDVESQETVFINSEDHPDVPLEYALMATACIPFFFKAMRIPGLPGLYVDGGATANMPMAVWDDSDRPTVGVRFASKKTRSEVGNTVQFTKQLIGSLADNANRTMVSTKDNQTIITIDSRGDSMKFDLTKSEKLLRYLEGMHAARSVLKTA